MKQLFETLKQRLIDGKDAVLVTVIASSGSTPRGSGSHMLVTLEGRIAGTIGGGAVEYKSTQMAMEALKDRSSTIHEFCLARNEVEDLGMICGGNVTVYFQFIDHADKSFITFIDNLLDLIGRGETGWLIMGLSEGIQGNLGVYGVKSGMFGLDEPEFDFHTLVHRAQHVQIGTKEYYVEELMNAGKVYVFGCGHVGQELVSLLTHVGFRCVAVDDRPEFASEKLFPDAERVVLADFNNIEKDIQLTEDDAACIMTRGHAFDTVVELQVLKAPVYYVGVIGSARKIAAVSNILREHGYSEETIAGIHAPIGLSIKAETPAEIAVSIAAELINERAKRLGRHT